MKRANTVSAFLPFFVHLNWNTLVLLTLRLVCLELGAKQAKKIALSKT